MPGLEAPMILGTIAEDATRYFRFAFRAGNDPDHWASKSDTFGYLEYNK